MEHFHHEILSEGFMGRFEQRYPTSVLEWLLADRTTGRNIIWADDEYEALGDGYLGEDEVTVEKITGLNSGIIKPRIAKEQERQSQRTKSRAEVFTPSWLCNQMNNDIDVSWFGRRDIFNNEGAGATGDGAGTWEPSSEPVAFPKAKGHGWQAYVEAKRLEITCGEAPFICSRYDSVSGEALPVGARVGFLDRKLRVVSERTKTRKDWARWAFAALKATYGFEYQGDNLLIARINVFETFVEHLCERWGEDPTEGELNEAAWIVSWNLWQMDGFTDGVPSKQKNTLMQSTLSEFEEQKPEPVQTSLFDLFDDVFDADCRSSDKEEEQREMVPLCVIYDWHNGEPFEFASLKGKATDMGKKFYAVIGNPPYQGDKDDNDRKPPIYDAFMDAAYEVGDRVELVTPGRFLFDAGQTPKSWNEKMLADEHLKVVMYESDASAVFPNTDIKGGIAVTLRDATTSHEPIGAFTVYEDLNSILRKVNEATGNVPRLDSIFASQRCYKFSSAFYAENAENSDVVDKLGPGNKIKIVSKVMEDLPDIFTITPSSSNDENLKFYGRISGQRVHRFILRRYIQENEYLDGYKLLIPEANNSGQYGETLAEPLTGGPGEGSTDTFLNAGPFETENEVQRLAKYYKTKFFRALLGVKKATQHSPSQVWHTIPLQNFTSASDIDWSKSIADIDRQLYAKYGLDDEEIDFIESHVKEMD